MHLALCEDHPNDLRQLTALIQAYSTSHATPITLTTFSNGEALLHHFTYGLYDAIFLDIYMGTLTGIQVAKTLRTLDEDVRIIFTTSSEDHFADGFAVDATHYLIKPLSPQKIADAMHRLRHIQPASPSYLSITQGHRTLQVPTHQILYVETIRNGVLIHCQHTTYTTRCSLTALLEQLQAPYFLHCHRCAVINMHAVQTMLTDAFEMCDGHHIAIRREGRRHIRATYQDFFMAQIRGERHVL